MSDAPVPPPDEGVPETEAVVEPVPVVEAAPPEPFPFWNLTDVVLFLGLGVPVFVVAFIIFAAPMHMLGVEPRTLRDLLPQFAGYGAALIPLWLIFQSRYGRSPMDALRFGTTASMAARSIPVGVAAAFTILALGVVLRTPRIDTPMEEMLRDPVTIVVVGILATTIGPLFEELFFRGLLQPVLVSRMGLLPGILLAALPFALLHGRQYAWSWRHIVLIAVAGALFGWWRHKTDSTGSATLMHAAYNLTLFVGFVVGRMMETEIPQAV